MRVEKFCRVYRPSDRSYHTLPVDDVFRFIAANPGSEIKDGPYDVETVVPNPVVNDSGRLVTARLHRDVFVVEGFGRLLGSGVTYDRSCCSG